MILHPKVSRTAEYRFIGYLLMGYAFLVVGGLLYVETQLLIHRGAISEISEVPIGADVSAVDLPFETTVATISGDDLGEMGLPTRASATQQVRVFSAFEALAYVGLDDESRVTEKWIKVAGVTIFPHGSLNSAWAPTTDFGGGNGLMLIASISGLLVSRLMSGEAARRCNRRLQQANAYPFAIALGYFVALSLWPHLSPWHWPQLTAALLGGVAAYVWVHRPRTVQSDLTTN